MIEACTEASGSPQKLSPSATTTTFWRTRETGRVRVTVVPVPGCDSSWIPPLTRSRTSATVVRPSPAPGEVMGGVDGGEARKRRGAKTGRSLRRHAPLAGGFGHRLPVDAAAVVGKDDRDRVALPLGGEAEDAGRRLSGGEPLLG